MAEPVYRRVVIKLSGEYLAGSQSFGIDQPHGTIALQAFAPGQYLFSTRIGLSLRRRLHGVDAHRYHIAVVASDPDNAQTASALVRLLAPLPSHRGKRS